MVILKPNAERLNMEYNWTVDMSSIVTDLKGPPWETRDTTIKIILRQINNNFFHVIARKNGPL